MSMPGRLACVLLLRAGLVSSSGALPQQDVAPEPTVDALELDSCLAGSAACDGLSLRQMRGIPVKVAAADQATEDAATVTGSAPRALDDLAVHVAQQGTHKVKPHRSGNATEAGQAVEGEQWKAVGAACRWSSHCQQGLICMYRDLVGKCVQADTCDEAAWPDKDHNLVCGECKVLVNRFDSVYGTCDGYCSTIGRKCVGAWEEKDDTCNVKFGMTCNQTLASSDAICQCAPEVWDTWTLEADSSGSGWAWDVKRVKFLTPSGQEISPQSEGCQFVESGHCTDLGWSAMNAFRDDVSIWGGRPDPSSGKFFVGIRCRRDVLIGTVVLEQNPGNAHSVHSVYLKHNGVKEADLKFYGYGHMAIAYVMDTWLVVASDSNSGWAWDVQRVQFISARGDEITPDTHGCQLVESGEASTPGYGGEHAFHDGAAFWGGRKDPSSGRFYIGIACHLGYSHMNDHSNRGSFAHSQAIAAVRLEQKGAGCHRVDSDSCLAQADDWGSHHTCASSKRWCASWSKDMQRCCPGTCGTPPVCDLAACSALRGRGECSFPATQADAEYDMLGRGACRTASGGTGSFDLHIVATDAACRQVCSASSDCVAYEYDPGNNICERHTTTITHVDDNSAHLQSILCYVRKAASHAHSAQRVQLVHNGFNMNLDVLHPHHVRPGLVQTLWSGSIGLRLRAIGYLRWGVRRLKIIAPPDLASGGQLSLGGDLTEDTANWHPECSPVQSGAVADPAGDTSDFAPYAVGNAFVDNQKWWGGRQDSSGKMYIGLQCDRPFEWPSLREVFLDQVGGHIAWEVEVQELTIDGWRTRDTTHVRADKQGLIALAP